ncbi:low temperature requirement protein A [Euzebya tangerina]|uniref:low temperature requirement protein A n=1 Tax=Euzebya tangerina TaxID=591198 RepID=UPI000E315159|nr:low temperature requirement protein A [Euzebya tangerina]
MALTKRQPLILRHRVDHAGEASWLELYFDLIYVAALIQLGNGLSDDVSWGGLLAFVGMFVLLWWTWVGTTSFMNRFAVDDGVHRALVFAQMFTVGNLALVAVAPLENRSSWLVIAYVVARLPLLAMYARVARQIPSSAGLSRLYIRVFSSSLVIWLLSLTVPEPWRYVVWGAALAVELTAPAVALKKTDPPPTHPEHFRERYALFTIIVLGESFVKVLTELSETGVSVTSQVLGAMGMVLSVALWWTYFDDIADSSIRPTYRFGALTWAYAHLPLTMALTALGVGVKKVVVVDSLGSDISANYVWLLVGSIAGVLIAAAVLDWVTISPHIAVGSRQRALTRLAGAALVIAVPLVLGTGPAALVIGVITAIVLVQIAAEVIVAEKVDKAIRRTMDAELATAGDACEDLLLAEDPLAGEPVCTICEEKGDAWVELRQCLVCGVTGCCDSSPGQHARAHAEHLDHPIIKSAERDDDWAYCFDHDAVFEDWSRRTTTPAEQETS